jgi:hypothetical protein
MNKEYLNFFLNDQIQINLITFVESLILASFLSFIIQMIYLKFSTSLSNKFDFSKNFIILGLTTTLVITIVKSSLALSLGLVGALSIVRFRAAIKEPEELVYLFLVISTGLGCGAGQLKITSIGISLAIFIIIIFSIFWKKKRIFEEEILNSSIIFNKRVSDTEVNDLIDKINPYCKEIKFVSLSSTENQTTLNLDLSPNNFKSVEKILAIAKTQDSKAKVMFAKKSMLSL